MEEFGEFRVGIRHQIGRAVVLLDLSHGKNQHLVTLNDRIQSMRNCDHRRLLELSLDQGLNLLLSDQINVGCGFIKDNDPILSQNGSADA